MNQYKAYAGVGSRETPKHVLLEMRQLAVTLGDEGWTLRSGHAQGADKAFEDGLSPEHKREIYLPWRGFEGSTSSHYHQPPEAFNLAAEIHPAWERLSQGARKLHARNVLQIHSFTMNKPCKFVVCYTEHGWLKGGTATAIRLAERAGIRVFNYGSVPLAYGSEGLKPVTQRILAFARGYK